MKSCEPFVSPDSEYFLYSPSVSGKNMFFYPVCTGRFFYQAGYRLERSSYDSFLVMYVQRGSLTLEFDHKKTDVSAGNFVLIDCYRPHAYWSETGWDSVWCHFDGPTARAFYQAAVAHAGNVFSLSNPLPAVSSLNAVYERFRSKQPVKEALVSKQLNDLLTSFLLHSSCPEGNGHAGESSAAEAVTAYISEHFAQDLSVERLAKIAGLSQYHFIRVFKRETGFTPHEYLVRTRLNTARYLLKNTRLPVKDICYRTGFSSESVFCSAFRKHTGIPPEKYRNQSPPPG